MEEKKKPVDFWLFTLTVALLVIGVFLVFDASYARAGQVKYTNSDSFFFLKRQAIFAVVGLLGMFMIMRVPYWKLRPWAATALILSVAGLVAVLVPGIGVEVNGARRWINVPGLPVQIQPSEFTKLALVLFLAVYLAHKQRGIRDLKTGLIPALGAIGMVGALIMAQPDMGTTIIVCLTGIVMLYIAGAKRSHLAAVLIAALLLGSVLIMSSPYRRARVMAFLDPFADYHGNGYQVCRSLIALGSGGVLGVGLCEGREKLFYLPAVHTDFIFSTLGEELGLFGTLSLSSLFLLFGLRGLVVASRTKENCGKFLAAGLSTLVAGQALLNIAVVSSSVPATGVPLPFISYGGSSLALNLLGVGILLGISQYPGKLSEYYYEDRANRRGYGRTRLSSA